MQGVHGMMIDNLLSARVITAEGKLVTASNSENPDLFWALRGAGHRFGLVTQVTFKTHDLSSLGSKDGSIWNGFMVWGEHQLEQLTDVVNSFNWNKHTSAYFAFANMPPDFKVYIYPITVTTRPPAKISGSPPSPPYLSSLAATRKQMCISSPSSPWVL